MLNLALILYNKSFFPKNVQYFVVIKEKLRQPIFSIDNSRENDKISMLQHTEFEFYVNKHHIWMFEKKKQM